MRSTTFKGVNQLKYGLKIHTHFLFALMKVMRTASTFAYDLFLIHTFDTIHPQTMILSRTNPDLITSPSAAVNLFYLLHKIHLSSPLSSAPLILHKLTHYSVLTNKFRE